MSGEHDACDAYDAGLQSVGAIIFAINDAGLFDDRGDNARAREQWQAGHWLLTLAQQTIDATIANVRTIRAPE